MSKTLAMPEIVRLGDVTYLGTPVKDKDGTVLEVKNAKRIGSTPCTDDLRNFIADSITGNLEPSVTVGGSLSTSVSKLKASLQAKWKMYIITLETAEEQAMPNLIRQAFSDLSCDIR